MLMLRKVYDWCGMQVHTSYALPLLSFLFFIEAIFFVPVDPLLILYCIEIPAYSFFFATVATVSSVAGGAAAYLIGYAVWESIGQWLVHILFSPATFEYAVRQYKQYEELAVLIAGFTPMPYKAVTLTAGFCKLPIVPFLVCSLIARGARFYLIALIIHYWGSSIKEYIDRYFNLFVASFALLVVGACWLLLR